MSNINASLPLVGRKRQGFSLIELLVVLTIISILSTISISMLAGLTTSNHLNEGTAVLQGQLELARQTARTLNRSVQLRFLLDQNNSIGPSIDTLQVVVPADNSGTDQAVEKPIALPPGVIVADGSDLSMPQLAGSGPTIGSFNPAPSARFQYSYLLTFTPSGAITATNSSGAVVPPPTGTVYWLVSVVPQIQYRANGSTVSGVKNYATLYLNSLNGTTTCVRP
jgi:prepilin-type N-terminal cleavage/methylation domain-containing protein